MYNKGMKLLKLVQLLILSLLSFRSNAQCIGSSMVNPIEIGRLDDCHPSFSDNTRSNANSCFNNFMGQSSPEIYYSFFLPATATVTISQCGTEIDSYLSLLNTNGVILRVSDDDAWDICNALSGYMQVTLPAGSYYIVSEGYDDYTGLIVTNISISPGVSCASGGSGSSLWNNAGTNNINNANSGNVGIGTSTPSEKLEVNGYVHINTNTPDPASGGLIVDNGGRKRIGFIQPVDREAGIWRASNQDFEIGRIDGLSLPGTPSVVDLYVGGNGNVGIGTSFVSNTDFKLFVEKGIRTRKVKVDLTSWADYVFEPTYKLPTLKYVEWFIKQHKHLPDVPTSLEVEKNGVDIGENQVLLLKKVEELTLYIIEHNKKMEYLERTNRELNERLRKLEKARN
ncbi:hypothetical protein V9K67_26860 [Paraflavisolibacter sp. H34]|uniref:hypothetical protein n=1 Tax=Huijunlia imazamoxiresistens TaxID=3127457 RepID=UPI00301A0524